MLETIPTRPAVVNDSNEPTHPHGADPKEDDNHSRSDFRPPPSERFDRLRDVLERDGPDPVAEPEHVRAGIDHIEMVESQIINRGVHRARRGRRHRVPVSYTHLRATRLGMTSYADFCLKNK